MESGGKPPLEVMQVDELPEQKESFERGRAWGVGFHVVLSSLSVLALVIMANYLTHRHNERFHLSESSRHKLTPLTVRVLSELTNDVKMIVFYDRSEALFGGVSSLAREYQARSPRIHLEFVDHRMPGRAEAVRNQYKFQADGDSSRIIFDSGGQVRAVLSSELSEYGLTPTKEVTRTGFRGEQLFTSAILNVTQTKPATAYFLLGHGEEGLGNESQGYDRLNRILQNNNVTVNALNSLIGTNNVPDDCSLLVIAGPTTPLAMEELNKIDEYLAKGGRMLALMNIKARLTKVGLESLLWKWNVQVGFDQVLDPAQAQAEDPNVIVTSHYGSHAIVRSLLRSSLDLVAPRSIAQRATPQTAADAPKITELLFTSSSGYAVTLAEGNRRVVTRQGAVPLAVAGERGIIQGVKTEVGATRFVVAGDAVFLSNALIGYAANGDFASLAINWLLNRDSLLNEIGPSPVSEYQVVLTQKQMSQIRWLFLGAIPGVVAMLGFFVWLRRRV